MEKIVYKSQIWDLHVHTPYKYNKSANSYSNDDNNVFVNKMVDIITKSENHLKMISFTDHNFFNIEVYKMFKEKTDGIDICIIPGIEMDLKLSVTDAKTKHILFYFPENEDYDKVSNLLNDYVKKNKDTYSLFDEFITYLFENKLRFAISPHAFKQGARGIESGWNDDNDEKNSQRIKMYSSNFFVFWESDKGSVPYAKEFIEKYYDDGTEAVTNFSDSHDYSIFKSFLDNPTQYFNALNNFNGILMASSEVGRIVYHCDEYLNEQKIRMISINNESIYFADKLNVIVGGRGKGKSILLDKIGYYFKCNHKQLNNVGQSRKKFLSKFDIKIKNASGVDINTDFKVKYLEQSYIDTLFKDESSKQIETYFEEEFDSIEIVDKNLIFADLKEKLLHINKKAAINKNVSNIGEKLLCDVKKKFDSIDIDKSVDMLGLCINTKSGLIKYNDYFLRAIPNKIVDDIIIESVNLLTKNVLKNIIDYNIGEITNSKLEKIAFDVVKSSNEKLDETVRQKNEIVKNIKEKLCNEYEQIIYGIRIINELYGMLEDSTTLNIQYKKFDGADDNKFYFIKYNNVEHPVEFARRILIEAINGKLVSNKEKLSNFDLFHFLLSDKDIYNTVYSKDLILATLKNLNGIKSVQRNKIIHYVKKEGMYQDLSISSPGMQTNSLMEYILNQNSDIPLLIDQPEDNVDNESRYNMLTRWIKNIKNKRQIILVSHDANIVINGDAENIIVADCVNSKFSYSYGALEYGNNIEIAATILDGGKDAIRKRIQKYGE